ncbi:TonB-dependent receptor [Sphingomonas sp. AOB5]|uniref:TonB-dependent receptor n=1 Tax=Sphingomonas sp. AOB5 TaxID=3034017 RepID=UPI0023FA3476|nr:TonB-dependent receptor [Sphingomonas sp. AOB5]MDF7777213.1 TonB-dependent receptor [Sphingomonas sp. AOB5]
MKKTTFYSAAAIAIAASIAIPGIAHAQDSAGATETEDASGISDIVVTASRTGETSAQSTPIAMSVFSADRLDGSLVMNVKDLVAVVPSLNVAQVTASAVIYMRGIGSSNVFGGSDPSVTTQLDGVYIARAFGQFQDFADVERLEVLRGPQGTLYGRNAIGGTINIISRKPSNEFTGKAQVTLGSYEAVTLQGFVAGPIVRDVVQVSLAASYVRRGDYFDNIATGQPGTQNANRGGVRGQVRIVPAPGVELITRADWSKGNERFDSYDHLLVQFRPGGANGAPLANSIVGDYHRVALNSPQFNRTEFWGISQEATFDLSDQVALKSLTAYRRSSYNLRVDSDGTEILAAEAGQAEISRQFSQEFNLTYNSDRLSGVIGLFYFHDKTSTNLYANNYASPVLPAANAFRINTTPDSYTRSLAAFAQATFKITPELGLTAGIRYTHDRKRIEQNFQRISLATNLPTPGFPFVHTLERDFDAFTPKFGFDWQVTPNVLVYGSVTRGFKSGGTSIFANNPADLSFAPEAIWSYEGGIKSDLLDRRLRINASVFRYDYTDLQVQSLVAPGVVAIRNAADARVTGAELEITAKPVEALTLTANYALLDAQYQSFPTSSVPNQLVPFLTGDPRFNAGTRTYNATGNRLNAAPEHQLSGSAQLNFDVLNGKAFLRGEYYYQSRVFYDPSNAAIFGQPGYSLINASIGWTSADKGWNIQLIGKNLTDEQYLITIAANGLVPAGLAGAPRTFALQVTKSW